MGVGWVVSLSLRSGHELNARGNDSGGAGLGVDAVSKLRKKNLHKIAEIF
jgi:hypothetical protein